MRQICVEMQHLEYILTMAGLATNRESLQTFNQLKGKFRFQLFLKSIFFKTVKNLFKNQSQRVVLQGCSALVTFWTRFSARSCLHPNLFLPSSLHDKILRILGINIKNEKMSQNIENLIFFIREKLHLVGLFTFTKFEQHLSNIRMNRHISKSQSGNLYSISLTVAVHTGMRCTELPTGVQRIPVSVQTTD